MSKEDFGSSHLDVCIRMVGGDITDDLLPFHHLAILLIEEAHSGTSLFKEFFKVFGALILTWEMKIIASCTDGAANMTECNVSFSTQLANATGNGNFYPVWGLARQLGPIVKPGLHGIADDGNFEFVKVAMTLSGWLQRQDALVWRMGSKCPYYISAGFFRSQNCSSGCWFIAMRCAPSPWRHSTCTSQPSNSGSSLRSRTTSFTRLTSHCVPFKTTH